MVLITETGRVEQRTVELEPGAADELVPELRARLNVSAAGRRLVELDAPLAQWSRRSTSPSGPSVQAVVDVVKATLAEATEERIVMAGASNLLRADRDFPGTVRPVLEALEEQVVLLRLLTEMAEDSSDFAVRIGHEHTHAGLAETSVVAAGYGADGETVARIGALGPTRMDYAGTIAAVRAVARYLSRILAG